MAFQTNIRTIALDGTGVEIPTLDVTDSQEEFLLTGTAISIGNYAIVPTGSPQLGTTFKFRYNGALDITTNGNTFSLFGQSITQAQLLKLWEATCVYNGSSWNIFLEASLGQTGIISSANIGTGTIVNDNIANNTIDGSTKLANLSVTTAKINDLAVTTGKVDDLAVTTGKLADNSVTTAKIIDANVTNAKLANMAAYTIKANNTAGSAAPQDVDKCDFIADCAWSLTGNAGTVAGTDFLGTTDAVDLVFKVNNIEAGKINQSTQSTSFGLFALNSNISASQSVGVGAYAVYSLTTGDRNTAVGYSSLYSLIDGSYNTAIGNDSSRDVTSGNLNSSIGYRSLYSCIDGDSNVAIAANALYGVTSGSWNVGVGTASGVTITTGTLNTCIGNAADVNSANSTHRISLGAGASATADYQFAIPSDVTHLNFVLNAHTNGALLTTNSSGYGVWNVPTIDAVTGDSATINAISGRFRKDTSGTTFTLTNSFISANSIILLTPANAAIDATATSWTVSAGSGSASIVFNAAPTADFNMNFLVIN